MRRFFWTLVTAGLVLGAVCHADDGLMDDRPADDARAADVPAGMAGRDAAALRDIRMPSAPGLSERDILDLADVLREAPSHGLPSLDAAADALLDGRLDGGRRDAMALQAYIRFAGWLEFGLIDPDTLEPRGLSDAETAMLMRRLNRALADGGGIHAAIDESRPRVRDYDLLRAEMLRVMALRPIWPAISGNDPLAPGDAGPRVDLLRARLAAEGLLAPDWHDGEVYDTRLETAVRRYQGRLNLAPSGRMDRATLRELNLPPDWRIAQLRANLEQRRWRTRQLGYRHIWVNLADYRLEAWEDGHLAREHQVMVGRQVSSTPEFSEEMQYIVINPWWGLPAGSARARFQSIRRNPRIVADQGFQIYDGAGQPISVYEIDWSRWGNDWPYRLSQPPGPGNPMGEVKFIFPNRYNVYIHDTVERDRFIRTRRDFSAGCIRVQDPLALAAWVLAGQDGWDRERIDSVAAGNTPNVVWLDRRIPVHIAYWTVVGDSDGRVRYLHDLYRRDGNVVQAYRLAYSAYSLHGLVLAGQGEGALTASLE